MDTSDERYQLFDVGDFDQNDIHIVDDKIKHRKSRKCTSYRLAVYRLVIGVLAFIVSILVLTIVLLLKRASPNNADVGDKLQTTVSRTSTETVENADEIAENQEETNYKNAICFPCEESGENITKHDVGSVMEVIGVVGDSGKHLCCMNDVGNLRKLFYLIISEYYRNVKGSTDLQRTTQDADGTQTTGATDTPHVPSVGPVSGSDDKVSDSGDKTSSPTNTTTVSTLQFWKKRGDAAHMFLDNQLLLSSNKTGQRIPWDGEDHFNLSMAHHRVVYHPDKRSIQVRDYGLYYVYSSITFKAPEVSGNKQVYHMLLREHYLLPNTGQTLMLMNKYGGGKQSRGYYTSFLCGTFYLRNGDEIFVRVSNTSYVYNFYYSNYIGLYRL